MCAPVNVFRNVEKEEDKIIVDFKNTKSAYSAREKLDNSKFDDNEVSGCRELTVEWYGFNTGTCILCSTAR